MTEKITVSLSHPIDAHGEVHETLEIREPKGGDIMECGHPMTMMQVGGETVMQVNAKVVGKFISRLAAIPQTSVAQLSAQDFSNCANVVMGFFGDSVRE